MEYRRLYDEVGGVRFEIAVTKAIRWHATGFFPSVGEFNKYVPDPIEKSLDEKIAKWKQEYESFKDDPEYQRELALLQQKLKQLSGK